MVDPKTKRVVSAETIQDDAPASEPSSERPSERWESATDLGKTIPIPNAPPRPPIDFGDAPKVKVPRPDATKSAAIHGIELVVVDETQIPGGERKPWRAAEVWTKRRVYGLDSTFKCVEILDRGTGRPEIGHEMLGARLGGGRARDKETVRFSYPLPLPGMEAMFMKGKKHGYTSTVERMVVRIRVLHTSADDTQPTWEEIANRWSDVPPDPRR
jgi:hypothetical protein